MDENWLTGWFTVWDGNEDMVSKACLAVFWVGLGISRTVFIAFIGVFSYLVLIMF